MKKLITVAIAFALSASSRAQLTALGTPGDMLMLSVGINQSMFNNNDFNAFSLARYRVKQTFPVNATVDLSFIGRFGTIGGIMETQAPYSINRFYFGVKLTPYRSKISSWLSLELGEVFARYKNIAPPHYILSPDQVGQPLQLQYKAGYIGFSLKNYLNFLQGNVVVAKTKIPVTAGFTLSAGLTPWDTHWRYGYYQNDSTFISHRVYNVPKLNKVYVNAGVFVGF